MPKVKMDDTMVGYFYSNYHHNLLMAVMYEIRIGKNADRAGNLTQRFFSEFFKSNPTLASIVKGVDLDG